MKQQLFTYKDGMNQDISKSKIANTFYYEGRNIRIITNESFGSVTNQKGNELVLTIPTINNNPTTKASLANLAYPLSNFQILGHTELDKSLYLLTKSLDPAVNFSKFYYSQNQSSAPAPYIDSNLRVLVDGVIVFESFVDSNGVVQGPSLEVGKNIRFQGFYLATEPNEPAPAPILYLDIYKNGILESRQQQFCGTENITLFYDIITEANDVWFTHAYTLPQPGQVENPFAAIDVSTLRLDGEPFAIWKVKKDFQIELKYFEILDVATKRIDVQSFYENENIQKIYWADGVEELRFINIADPKVMNLDKKFLSTVPKVNLNQPEIIGFEVGGSSHTSGSIQYAYNLYNQYGAQTRISPLSEISYLNNKDIGNQVEAKVSKSPLIQLTDLDTTFSNVRVYSIKYDIKNTTPKISLIYDRPIQKSIKLIDDNNSVIQEIAFSEFVFLGGEVYIPQHLFIKDNHLFLANYKTTQYDIDFDARAYRYNKTGNTIITDSNGINPISFNIADIGTTNIPYDFDAVNSTNKAIEQDADYNKYIWKSFGSITIPSSTVNYYNYRMCAIDQSEAYNIYFFTYTNQFNNIVTGSVVNNQCVDIIAKENSVFFQSVEMYRTILDLHSTVVTPSTVVPAGTLGGLGPNVGFEVKYREVQSNIGQPTMSSSQSLTDVQKVSDHTGLKSGETYRVFIEFLFDDGKFGFPKWIADVKIPDIGSEGSVAPVSSTGLVSYPFIEVELVSPPVDSRITGWRSVIVERTESDKTVLTQGLFNPAIIDNFRPNVDVFPSYFQRTARSASEPPTTARQLNKPQRFNTSNTDELNLSSNKNSTIGKEVKEITSVTNHYTISVNDGNLYTPEAVLSKANLNLNGTRLRTLGLIKNTHSSTSTKVYNTLGVVTDTIKSDRFTATIGTDLSRNTLQPGATLLTNIIVHPTKSSWAGKFIGDNRLFEEEIFWSKKTFAFVRYFGGYSKVRDLTGDVNNIDADSRMYQMSAIENIYAYKNASSGTSVNFATGADIPVLQGDEEPPNVVMKSYSGSNIALIDISQLLTIDLTGLGTDDYGLMMEIYRVLSNQYGGNSYQSRQINRTIPYSKVEKITTNKTTEHYGDTFIQKFNCLRTFKSDNTEIYMSEIISIPVETSINLDLRYDLLKYRPNNEDADELTSYGYNNTYDQLNNTIRGVAKPSNFTEINNFPTSILPSKIKIPNENIDSFTDFLTNDVKMLDGKYGEITGVGEHNDNIYAFQRNSIAYLSINPRVQLNASDGIQVELGSGNLIERYQYVSTNSGTVNKWSVVKSKNGLMYFDLLNKSINFIVDQELSTVKGFYNKIKNYVDINNSLLEVDNVILNQGVHAHYDSLNEDTYFTFLTDNDKFTIAYNGLAQAFTSYYDFVPKYYIQYGNKLVSTVAGTNLWQHEKGRYQTYYDVYYPASITIMANPEPYVNKIFNNIMFEGETYVNGSDIFNLTFNKIRVWNEYQDSGLVDLLSSTRPNLKRKFRNWNIQIPRSTNKRDRINNPWTYIKLEMNKPDINDYQLILHDLLLSYLI